MAGTAATTQLPRAATAATATTMATPEQLRQWSARAAAGDRDAAWRLLHALIDVFDAARFARDDEALAVLWNALELAESPRRGAEATELVSRALLSEADALLAGDRLLAAAQDAHALLAIDAEPPVTMEHARGALVVMQAIARGTGPLADNAALRLAAWCVRALADAAASQPADRHYKLLQCAAATGDPAVLLADTTEPPSREALLAAVRALLERAQARAATAAAATALLQLAR